MKKSDVVTIILLIVISGIVAYIVAGTVIGKPQNNPVQVEQVTKIDATFPTPDSRIFNDKAIDPTVQIQGSGQSTEQPFGN